MTSFIVSVLVWGVIIFLCEKCTGCCKKDEDK